MTSYKRKYLSVYTIDDGYGVVGSGWLCPHCDQRHNFESVDKGCEYTCEDCQKVSVAKYDSGMDL